ncbi:MAG: AbrB/MazE/SpoVT family DNA-binding domain-containing protein [Candidatus Hodarchaeales archaeon]
MSVVLELDERGRITIPKKWREGLNLKRTIAIRSKQGILLVPISENPLNRLNGAFTTNKTVKELKQKANILLLKEK